jgi:DNA-binding CsgD family transcriptional regulator/putative methionine-R-sulfoxide reductase with GAF domain
MKAKAKNHELQHRTHGWENNFIEINSNKIMLRRKIEELAAITALTREVTSNLSMKQMIASTHKQIHFTVSPDLTVIYLKQGDKLILQEMEEDNLNIPQRGPKIKEVGECLCGIVAETGEPVYSMDINSDPCCTLDQCKNIGIRSFAALPLLIGNEILGVLGIASLTSRKFSDQAYFLETIASQIAICLHNSSLYEQIQQHAIELETHLRERRRAAAALKKREKELELKTKNLEEVNTALKVLLKQRDEDKTELEEKMVFNVKELVLPYMEKLKKGKLNNLQKSYISIQESNLNEIISPFVRTLSSSYFNLTPKEIQVADLIKKGKTSKEIAELLNSSTRVIDFHRNNLRKKFGLINKKTNLRSYLLALS